MKKIAGILKQILVTEAGQNTSIPIQEGVCTFEGLIGDRHYGNTMFSNARNPEYPRGTEIRNRRQITILSQEELQEIADNLDIPHIDPAWLAGNLLMVGIPHLTQLPPTSRIFFSNGTVLVIDAENKPCGIPAKIIQGLFPEKPYIRMEFVLAAMHRRGLVAWVERPGKLTPGMLCEVEIAPPGKDFWES